MFRVYGPLPIKEIRERLEKDFEDIVEQLKSEIKDILFERVDKVNNESMEQANTAFYWSFEIGPAFCEAIGLKNAKDTVVNIWNDAIHYGDDDKAKGGPRQQLYTGMGGGGPFKNQQEYIDAIVPGAQEGYEKYGVAYILEE